MDGVRDQKPLVNKSSIFSKRLKHLLHDQYSVIFQIFLINVSILSFILFKFTKSLYAWNRLIKNWFALSENFALSEYLVSK